MSSVLIGGVVTNLLYEIEVPVAALLNAAESYPHEVGRRQPEDAFPQGLLAMCDLSSEILGHHSFIGNFPHSRIVKELVKLRGDQDEIAAKIIIERPDAEYVARTEESAYAAIPNSESKITQDADGNVFSPLQVRFQNEFGIGVVAQYGPVGLKSFAEIFAVVNATVEDQANPAAFIA